jgi:hypothetical protein
MEKDRGRLRNGVGLREKPSGKTYGTPEGVPPKTN